MTKRVHVLDTKRNKLAFLWVSEAEAHKRVDGLNASYGFRRFRVVVPGQLVGMD